MHQSHNIPWHTFSINYKAIRGTTKSEPSLINIIPLKRPMISQDVNHFIRKFSDTVQLFAATERAKYPSPPKLPSLDKLFTDELREKHPTMLNKENQMIEQWLAPSNNNFSYRSRADIIRFLLHENELLPLLTLANHPQFSMSHLIEWNLDQWKEFSHVKSAALRAYIVFNVAAALDMLSTREYAESAEYRAIIQNIAQERDYEGQDTMHMKFLRRCGILVDGEICWEQAALLHEKYEILQEYLKDAFALIYRYEVFFREECGSDPRLEWEVSYCAPICTPPGVHNPVVSSFTYT